MVAGVGTTKPETKPGDLQRNAVGLTRVIAFTAAFMGPAASIALGLVAAISFAGFATPFVVLLSFAGALFASNSIAQLAKKFPSAGSLYTYNASTLGARTGFMSGWLMTFAYIMWVPAGIAATGTFFSAFFHDAFGVNINENIFLVVLLLLVVYLAYRGISLSANIDLIVLVVEILVIAGLAATILIRSHPGPGGAGYPFNPGHSINGKFSDIAFAMIYTVVIFTGFESGAVLGEESRNPRRNVPRGIFGAVIIVGAFYLFVSYAQSRGVALGAMPDFLKAPLQLGYLSNRFWSSSWAWLMDLVVALSTLAFVLAAFNAATRLIFAMGREHMAPRRLASLSRHHTPHVAALTVGLISLIIALPLSLKYGGFLAFAYAGALSGLALIILFMTASVAVIVAYRGQFKADFRPFQHLVLPVLAILTFALPLVGTWYPVPASPFRYLPYITIFVLLVGIGVTWWLSTKRSDALSRIGRVFLVEGPEQPYPSAVPAETVVEGTKESFPFAVPPDPTNTEDRGGGPA